MPETKPMTGYPSIDKPWLKYYSIEAINAPLPEYSIYEYLRENNKDHLDDTALIYFGRKITYRELFENINRVASAFLGIGVKRGDIVTVALPNIPENIYCIYALNRIGAIADMVDLRSQGETLVHYLNEAESKIAVICGLFAENTFSIIEKTIVKKTIVVSVFDSLFAPLRIFMKLKNRTSLLPDYATPWKLFLHCNRTSCESTGSSDDEACIFHTSGTTGTPKGVMMTNLNFNAMALHARNSGIRFDYGKRIMNQVPPFLAFNALCSMHLPLVSHMQMVLLPEYRPDKFAENIVKTKASCCLVGPADWSNFLENEIIMKSHIDLSCLVSPISGSDALTVKTKNAVNEVLGRMGCPQRVLEGYGMTEIGSAACANTPQFNNDASVGIPLPYNTFCIYDNDQSSELPYWETGEICMTGPTVMKGYFKNETATKEILRKHSDGLTWLHSGDIGHMDKDGCVYIEGRLKRIIVRHDGIKISPFSIEKLIMTCPEVSSCCVVGSPDCEHQRGYTPVAFIVLNAEVDEDITKIQNLCEAGLNPMYWPNGYRFIDQLPLTPNGKVDYRKLEEMARESNCL